MNRNHWQVWVEVLVGVVLLALPFVLTYTLPDGARFVLASFVVSGLAIALLGLSAAGADQGWQEWIIVLFGAWVTVSPWLLGFVAVPSLAWSAVILGVVAIVLGGWSLADTSRQGHA